MIKIINHVLQSMDEVVSNEYNYNHQALDIVSNDHTPSDIIALESGIVESVVKNIENTDHNTTGLDTYGNYVKIKQTDGKSALYAHMEYGSIDVNKGDFVEKGAIIGTMGETGNAYGKHLHLEIKNENNINENPITELIKQTKETNIKQENKEETDRKEKDNINQENKKEAENTEIKQNNREKAEYLNNTAYKYGSIVDGLKEINIDSSFDYRKKIAEKNGITNYRGSYEQNIKLLNLLKEGKLIKA